MVKKILSNALLLSLPLGAYANSNSIELSLNTHQDRQGESSVSLAQLSEKVLYKIECVIEQGRENATKTVLKPRLLPQNHYNEVKFNKVSQGNNSATLHQGLNTLSFRVLIEQQGTEEFNQFAISSAPASPTQLLQCTATQQNMKDGTATNETLAKSGGFFFAKNKTNKAITIAVGNIIPTEYKIAAGDYRTVWVSSDNQNIEVRKIH